MGEAHTTKVAAPKAKRSRTNCGVKPQTVNEAILNDLYGTATTTDIDTKHAPQHPDLFHELFGPNEEANDDALEQQLELDLSEL